MWSFSRPNLYFYFSTRCLVVSCSTLREIQFVFQLLYVSSFIISICFITDLCCSVKIQKISVPSVVVMDSNLNLSERPNLSAPEFLLDCDYEVSENESGLVIKWFLNNQLVYQWIPPRMPTALSLLKNRIKKNFTVSDDPIKKYRGLTVMKPMLNFSGEYTCSVQTFQSSDKKSSFLQIIGKFKPLPNSNLKSFTPTTPAHPISPCEIDEIRDLCNFHFPNISKHFQMKIDNSKIISN